MPDTHTHTYRPECRHTLPDESGNCVACGDKVPPFYRATDDAPYTFDGAVAGSPTMPDTLTREELARIRQRDENWSGEGVDAEWYSGDMDRRALLAHIDALTAAVEALPNAEAFGQEWTIMVDRAAVLAILRGEQ